MKPRAAVFEKRAREPDPDKRVYGPKMVQKVLDLCAAPGGKAHHAAQLMDNRGQVYGR